MSKISPQRFGKYVLLRRLALGGMAEIFKAKVAGAEGFEKDLVIKRILPQYSDDETFVQMFVDEARLTAKLQHPNIVQIFDFDEIDGSYYIAMEYVEGKDLKDLIDESARQGDPVSVAQVVWIAAELCKGLQYAHTKEDKGEPLRIVHRDVTPSNVMITYRGDVKLMDFGIAKATQRSTKTQAGAVKGKVAYMSPEQARGKPVDGRTDIFALGVIMWEMLTGTRLFNAESDFDTLNNVLRMDPPPPSSLDKRVPPELDAMVLKALAKDPAQRWSSAEVLGRELTRWYFTHVTDLEKEKLKPLMYRVFKKDIDQLERLQEEEEAMLAGRPSPDPNATVVQSRVEDTAQNTDQSARVEALIQHRGAVGSHIGPAEAGTQLGTPRKPSPLPWILLVLLLVGGGTAIALLLTMRGDTPKVAAPTATTAPDAGTPGPQAPTAPKATLYLKVVPHTASVKVDGTPAGGEVPGLAVGQKVRVVAEAPGFQRFEEIVTIDGPSPVFEVKMQREGIPHRVVIKPTNDEDEVLVNDVKLGNGTQPYEGLLDQDVVVRVIPAIGGPPVTKVVRITEALALLEIATVGELVISIDPPDAAITTTLGKQETREPGLVAVTGLRIGDTVTLEAKAKDRKPFKTDVVVAGGPQAIAVKLERTATAPGDLDQIIGTPSRPPTRPTNPPTNPTNPPTNPTNPPTNPITPPDATTGSLVISAKPWAQVTLNGRPRGTTPQTIKDLPTGPYTVVLTKGQQSVTKQVVVTAGGKAQIFVDFTEM